MDQRTEGIVNARERFAAAGGMMVGCLVACLLLLWWCKT